MKYNQSIEVLKQSAAAPTTAQLKRLDNEQLKRHILFGVAKIKSTPFLLW